MNAHPKSGRVAAATRLRRRPRPWQGSGFSVLAATTVIAPYLLSNAVTPLLPYWQSALGVGAGGVTVIFATYMVGLTLSLVAVGRIADRFGRRVVIVPGLVCAITAAALFMFADHFVMLIGARFLTGLAAGASVAAGVAAVVDLGPRSNPRLAPLIASLAIVAGAGLGPLVAGLLAVARPDSPAIAVFGVIGAVQIAALTVALGLPLRRPRDVATRRLIAVPTVPAPYRRDLFRAIGAFAPGITSTSFALALGPTLLASVGVHGAFPAGALVSAMFVVSTVVQFAATRLSVAGTLRLSSLAAITSMLLVILTVSAAPSPATLGGAALFAGIAQGLGQLGALDVVSSRIPQQFRAEANAALNVGGYLPAGLGIVVVGFGADLAGLTPAVSAFACVVAAVATLNLWAAGTSAT